MLEAGDILRIAAAWAAMSGVLGFASPTWAGFPERSIVEAELERFVTVHRGGKGVVVGLLGPGDVRTVIARGASGRAERPTIDGNTRFEIGSVTKTFTGLLLADMVARREVGLKDRVGALLPGGGDGLAPEVAELTLEDLATHTSGLPRLPLDLGTLTRLLSTDPYRTVRTEDLYRSVRDLPPSKVQPDGTLQYSNLGYALLGRLLEARGGAPWEELVKARLLEPFGLAGVSTGHRPSPGPELARGHGMNGRPVAYWHLDGYAPAGSLIASANDMLDYVALQLAAEHLPVVEAQRLRRTFEKGRGIGLGWLSMPVQDRTLLWHNGGTGGFRSFVGFLPGEARGLVVLANGHGDVDGLARRLLDPGAPELPAYTPGWYLLGLTLFLVLWGPFIVFRDLWRARPEVPSRTDRIGVLARPVSLFLLYLLAERLGAWRALPFALWWLSLGATVVLYGLLLSRVSALPAIRPGWRRKMGVLFAHGPEFLLVWLCLS